MAKATILVHILLLLAMTAYGQQTSQDAKDLMKQRVQYGRQVKHGAIKTASKRLHPSLEERSLTKSSSTLHAEKDTLLVHKYQLVHRRATYSICSGFRNPGGAASIKFEDRFVHLNTHLQPGIAIGFSPISGLRLSAGMNFFILSERHKVMPFVNAQYVYSSGNRLASTTKSDSFYCITGKGKYLNLAAGIKIKPLAESNEDATKRPEFLGLLDIKLLVGYSFVLQHAGIDSFPVAPAGWDFKMNRIRNNISSGCFVEVNLGIDIPFIRETELELIQEAEETKEAPE